MTSFIFLFLACLLKLLHCACMSDTTSLPSTKSGCLLQRAKTQATQQASAGPLHKQHAVLLDGRSSLQAPAGSLPPDVIIQYGEKRTATTLQHHSLCLAMNILHSGAAPCPLVATDEISTQRTSDMVTNASVFPVIKTHYTESLRKMVQLGLQKGRRVLVFATAINDTAGSDGNIQDWQASAQHLSRNLSVHVEYAQITKLLSKRGYHLVEDYASFFQLSDNQTQDFMTYIRYWDVLRQCCGKQMSADWFAVLAGDESWIPHHSPEDSAYPACETYNLDEVEQDLITSHAFQQYALMGDVNLRKVSGEDGEFNGTYCSRFSSEVRRGQEEEKKRMSKHSWAD
mmetsp:Transcript_76972/g.135668  ORF Transcript_76972/g.135668 Transcript_76972/m.135668 type:complete len:342 (-) Transcript_76972:41-1066(-)|eukprot:CAMPEP_0197658494 /NCGR_PEP_ID=MMETSP1338-20131121/45272_1 /TAXON_ID=43686 ORGANISM="Pelagodinium beii, Strain RCC1491" /NCGR_SAMPLE_ID=MMETSP1338 /ASSEMBLY_ACC=CAM_ASM_000754 /LENGTH=341 /DNA_ID=CAMNT_0043235095 /DNA_START=48 /DNA_END=1073 /DNA_ORIENTATION=+